ncbi:SulP family inorganic anion transporter [Alkalilimnicola ehrlichii MLHE-1]|uniref:Sulfate transporter n=1 Tax=Alkalilimnicola ehrlichii (strain ATCC BAA-1101 / DSM 17681 / MLHE-1) TaxID=187272 RepID=Q0A931_ALKEH|nr:sulfate permease [Alkalilimnicola ehrlichii]ABI56656.1 sulfate transporter [Alkalilimnicola ehrlichii MLHE-1]
MAVQAKHNGGAAHWLPLLGWLRAYRPEYLAGDLIAGAVVAVMLVPQAMAYAMLANLPPHVGLYASIIPPVAYALFASSRALAVGPVAIVSLMVASVAGAVAAPGSAEHLGAAVVLALLSGIVLLVMGMARLGFVTQFLSHPVLSGFITAAAVLIGFSQLRHVLGVEGGGDNLPAMVVALWQSLGQVNGVTLAIGLTSIGLLLWMQGPLKGLLVRSGLSAPVAGIAVKTAPLVVVVLGSLAVALPGLDEHFGVSVVGRVPEGLPDFALPAVDLPLWRELVWGAVLIALVGFLESASVAKSLAARDRERIDPDRELKGLGLANIGASLSGGYPVTGGISRSVVNYSAGARTPMAGVLSALLIVLVLLFLTPWLAWLPHASLAAIILVAVVGLVDLHTPRRIWQYSRSEAVTLLTTAAVVLVVGVEAGIVVGVLLSLGLYLWRTSRPHMAVVGRVPGTEHYRNVERHKVETDPRVLLVRVDESLYFPNTRYLEDRLQELVWGRDGVEHVVLICSAVNFIDASALESLEELAGQFADSGVTLHLAEVKGPVMDGLEQAGFTRHLRGGRVFLSTHEAMKALGPRRRWVVPT